VRALALTGDSNTVYAGGDFTLIGGQPRNRLAAIDTTTAAIDPAWDPNVDLSVESLKFLDNFRALIAGGQFTMLDGVTRIGLAGFDFNAPVTVADPPPAIYNEPQTVNLNCTDPAGSGCAQTFYTLDGTDPVTFDGQTPGSPSTILYTRPLKLNGNTLIKYFSVDNVGNREQVIHFAQYFIDLAPPVSSANPPGDEVYMSQKLVITLSCTDGTGTGCANIFYTVDGSPPTTSSVRYTGPIVIKESTVLKYFAVDKANNEEGIHRVSYVNTYGGIGSVNWFLVSLLIAAVWINGSGRCSRAWNPVRCCHSRQA